MMRSIKTGLPVGALALALAVPSGAGAGDGHAVAAHNKVYKPTVAVLFLAETFDEERTDVVGLFDFTKGVGPAGQLRKCEKNRKGILLRVKKGRDAKVGTFKTDRHGNIDEEIAATRTPPGTYYGKYPKRVLKRGGGHKHVCKGAKTKRTTWPPR